MEISKLFRQQMRCVCLPAICTVLGMMLTTAAAQGQSVIATIPAVGGFLVENTVTNKIYTFGGTSSSLTMTVIDGATNAATNIPLVLPPYSVISAVAINEVTNKIYVAGFLFSSANNFTGPSQLTVIDGLTNAMVTIPDTNAMGIQIKLAVNQVTNKIYKINSINFMTTYGGNVSVIDGATNAITTINSPNFLAPNSVAVNSVTNKIYVSSINGFIVIDGATNSLTATGINAGFFAINSVTNKIYATGANILSVDGVTNAATTIPVPLGSTLSSSIAVNTVTNKIYATTYGGPAGIIVADGSTNKAAFIASPSSYTSPALALNAVTNKIYVANGDRNNITVVDGTTQITYTLTDPNAVNPSAVVVNPVTNRIYVLNQTSNNVTVVDGNTPRYNPPSCQLSGVAAGPPALLSVAIQDITAGLKTISVVESINASVSVPTFAPGSTSSVLVIATKLNQSLGSNVGFVVTNMAGLSTSCDPVDFRLELEGQTEQHVFRSLPASEHYVRIYNGTPGVRQITFLVNGHLYPVPELKDGENYMLDIGSGMVGGMPEATADRKTMMRGPVRENNNVVMRATGVRGSSAYVLVGDASIEGDFARQESGNVDSQLHGPRAQQP